MDTSNITVARKFWFRLSQKCLVKRLENSKNVKFHIEHNEYENYITEFSIVIDDPNENASESKAIRIAESICNFISIIRGKFVRPHLYGRAAMLQNGTKIPTSSDLRIDLPYEYSLDFDIKTKMQIIIKNAETFRYVSNSVRAYEYGDTISALRDLYLAIETKGSLSSLRIKFEPLRNALSHHDELYHDTKEKLEFSFGQGYFKLTPRGTFDHASSQNQIRLDEQIRILLTAILSSLRQEIQNQN